jgi:hypothetical protein
MNDKTITLNNLEAAACSTRAAKPTDIQHPELWNFPMDYPLSIIGHEGHKETLIDEVKLILGTFRPTLVTLIIGLYDLICDRSKRNLCCKSDYSGGLLTQGERSSAHA